MTAYIAFPSEAGREARNAMLVEVSEIEVDSDSGEQKAGLRTRLSEGTSNVIAVAQSTLESALEHAIKSNMSAILHAVDNAERQPDELEVTFGLKGTGEASNIAIGKLGSEINYQVKIVWKAVGH
jgi:Trypsin-co-occurring domain 1